MTEILHHTGTDPKTREEIEIEREAWRTVNAMFEEKEKAFKRKLEEQNEKLEEQNEKLEEQRRLIEELEKKLREK